jgi:hypothetical protein
MKELWKNTTPLAKILIVIIFLLVADKIYMHFKFRALENNVTKEYKNKFVRLKDSLYISERKQEVIQKDIINEVNRLKSTTSKINRKFIQDEKQINNLVVTDDDIIRLLTRFRDGARP